MKTLRNYLCISLCLLVYYGCHTASTTQQILSIELDADVANYPFLDDVNMQYEILSLEQSDKNSIVPNIDKIIEHENRLYILSSQGVHNGVYIFNVDGSYITSLKKGRALNEFMAAADINIDHASRRLELLDRAAGAVLSYSLSGEFISRSDLPRKNMSAFCKLPNSQYLIFTPFHSFKEDTDSYFKRVEGAEIVQSYLDKPKELKNFSTGWNISQSGKNIYCYGTYGDTCYRFNSDDLSLEPYFQISPVLETDNRLLRGDSELLKGYFSRFNDVRVLNDENLVAFRVSKDRGYSLMYNREDKTIYQGVFNDIPFIGNFLVGHSDNAEYFCIDAEKIELLKNYSLKSKTAQNIIKELLKKDCSGENPYIIRLTYDTQK